MNPAKKNSNVPPKPGDITYFAESDYRNRNTKFGIRRDDRTRHMYVIGKTGMGKTTLLQNMAIQDIRNGNGMAFIDPHGEVADNLLDYIPQDRIKDVMYFAPFDLEHPISFNVMEDVGPDKRHLVADGLLSAFKKIWVDMWSGRMEYLLNNALLALLEYPDATILGVNRMFADKAYRKRVVANVTDVSVKAFWEDEFAGYDQQFAAQAASAIQNKVGQFVSNPQVRNIVGQVKSSFDVRELMDNRKIMLINLSKGQVGEDNARLIGSMLITKMYLAAMSRADTGGSDGGLANLPQFYFYVDEFQSFANESFAGILSEARKYKLNLTIAHQYIEQMSEDVRNAVFGNVGTMISFRVGAFDAEVLEKEFAPEFEAEDLVNLGFAQIYLKLMVNGVSSKPFSARTLPPIDPRGKSYRDKVREWSRGHYGRPRDEVEAEVDKWHDSTYGIIDDELARQMAEKQRKQREDDPDADPIELTAKEKKEIVKNYKEGQIIQGPVNGIADFGIFVEVEPGLEGLVHISEISDERIDDLSEVYDINQKVTAKVIETDGDKISLSIKQVEQEEGSQSDAENKKPEDDKTLETESEDSSAEEIPKPEPKLIKKKSDAKEDDKKTTEEGKVERAKQAKSSSVHAPAGEASLSKLSEDRKDDKGPSTANRSKLQQALAKVKSSVGSNVSADDDEVSADESSKDHEKEEIEQAKQAKSSSVRAAAGVESKKSKEKDEINQDKDTEDDKQESDVESSESDDNPMHKATEAQESSAGQDDDLPANFSEEELREMLSVDQDEDESSDTE